MSPGLLAVNLNKKKRFDDLQGICNRSIHLLELRFHWSIQVDFMRHVIWMSIARVTSLIVAQELKTFVTATKFVAAWIKKLKLESR